MNSTLAIQHIIIAIIIKICMINFNYHGVSHRESYIILITLNSGSLGSQVDEERS
jgi:hypothetical protein